MQTGSEERAAQWDTLLEPYLAAGSEGEKREALEGLFRETFDPVIRAVVRRELPEGPLEDLEAEARVAVLARLRQEGEALSDARGYVAVTAYRICHGWLRERRPNWTRLRMRVRYLVENDGRFRGRCGEDGQDGETGEVVTRLGGERERALPELLERLFAAAPGKWKLGWVVRVVAEVQGVADAPVAALPEDLRAPGSNVAAMVERRRSLETLWTEIGALPLAQRQALLWNLRGRDGESLIEALPVCGVASLGAIARAMEMEGEEFSALWNRLPIEDAEIAERLGRTRQQVINLRKSARERLWRRLPFLFTLWLSVSGCGRGQ